ncbi:hypothetical protein ON010_g1317 [Phytophthora cinnamomi]|nr:hypothetical protein ON010_g1317 [Phytophthora cinnamomi]
MVRERRVMDLHEQAVQTSAGNTAHQVRHDRDPEVVVARREDLGAPAGAEREQTRTEVARRVHGIARVHAEGHAQSHDHEAEGERSAHGTGRTVALVRDGVDAEHQHGRADELGVEGRVVGDVVARVSGPTALRLLAVRVDDVQVLVLHDVDDEGADEGAQQLRDHVAGRLPPRQAAVHAVRERDGRVEVGAADALGAVDADEHADSPAHVDAEPRAVLLLRVGHLVVHAHAEDDHDEGAEELGEALAHVHALHGEAGQAGALGLGREARCGLGGQRHARVSVLDLVGQVIERLRDATGRGHIGLAGEMQNETLVVTRPHRPIDGLIDRRWAGQCVAERRRQAPESSAVQAKGGLGTSTWASLTEYCTTMQDALICVNGSTTESAGAMKTLNAHLAMIESTVWSSKTLKASNSSTLAFVDYGMPLSQYSTVKPLHAAPNAAEQHVRPDPQPQAVPDQPHGQARGGATQVGHGVQGRAAVRGLVHEPAAGQHGGVHQRRAHGQPGRDARALQQRALHPRPAGRREAAHRVARGRSGAHDGCPVDADTGPQNRPGPQAAALRGEKARDKEQQPLRQRVSQNGS